MEPRTRNLVIIGCAILLFFGLCATTAVGGAALYWFVSGSDGPVAVATAAPRSVRPTPPRIGRATVTPIPPRADQPQPETGNATPAPQFSPPVLGELGNTEAALAQAVIPTRDMRDLALRLKPGMDDIPVVVNSRSPDYQVGDVLDFWVANTDENSHFQIKAELVYRTDVVYAWVEAGQEYDLPAMRRILDRFSEESYPLVREFFGSEWNPGVDNDPRLHILHATNMGSSIAGYYSSADEFSRLANQYSNEKEMFYISLDILGSRAGLEFYETVLAHEFQHMVHWANDRNEETWVNEGMSELAQEIAGFPPDTSFSDGFADVPDTQLNTWADEPGSNGVHYGSAYLFMAYFLQRFGPELTQSVVAHAANGPTGFTQALTEAGLDLSFDHVFVDWVVANYVDDPTALGLDGIYGYVELDHPQPITDKSYRRYPAGPRTTTVYNYATDYIELTGSGDVSFNFSGQTETQLADVQPYSGDLMWWANRSDDSNTRLTRQFDLSGVDGRTPVEMVAQMWWDIETDYDYGYVLVSQDGDTWQILPGERTSTENPSGNSFGPGFTDISAQPGFSSPDWVQERFDLSDYAGEEIWVRFEYVTDDAVNRPGWFVDDISIPALDYATDFEAGPDGWESEGWLLTDNRLAQGWAVQVLSMQDGELVALDRYAPDRDGNLTLDMADLGGSNTVIIAISGLAPVTTEAATYTYEIVER